MLTIAIICIVLAVLLLWRWRVLKKREKEEKGFIVLGTTLLLIYLFPGAALLIVGLVLIALLGGGCGM